MNIAGPKGGLKAKPLSVKGLHKLMAEFRRRSNFGCLENAVSILGVYVRKWRSFGGGQTLGV
jgi:hypothetical protein